MILDFGCGAKSKLSDDLEDVVGIDINLARLRRTKNVFEVVCCDGTRLPFRGEIFDRSFQILF